MIQGTIKYTANAFGQDAELAIRGDIVLALLELITNADDAYAAQEGPILISISKEDPDTGVTDVSVGDKARGLSPELLLEKFTVLGGDNDQFRSGDVSRGLLGRGAKDVASLGSVTFSTIKDGIFSTVTLSNDGTYVAESGVPATGEHRAALRLKNGENGLTATVHVQSKLRKIRIPKLAELQKKLSTHAQLRDLIQRRELVLLDQRSPSPSVRVTWDGISSEVVLDETFQIPGYEHDVRLILNRLAIPQSGKPDAYSEHGVLVKSGITIYENTAFGQDAHPSMGVISGEVITSEINSLIRNYDLKNDKTGVRLIRRDRDGLVKEHPYAVALTKAVQSRLLPMLNSIQQEAAQKQSEGENLKRALKDAARALRNEVNELMKELEQDPSGPGEADAPITVIPSQLKMKPDSKATLTIRIKGNSEVAVSTLPMVSKEESLFSISVPSPLTWRPHERLDAVVATVQVEAGHMRGSDVVALLIDDKQVLVPVIIAEPTESAPKAVTKLEFVTPNARIAPTRTRRLEVRAPITESDNAVTVAVSGVEVASASDSVILRPSSTGLWSSAVIEVKAGVNVGSLTVQASTLSGDKAAATLLIQEGGPAGGIELDFELRSGENSKSRVLLWPNDGVIRMYVHTDHKAFNNVFGKYDESAKKYSREDSPEARQTLVEVLSRALGEHFTVEQSVRQPLDFSDGNRYFARCHELTNRFTRVLHAALQTG